MAILLDETTKAQYDALSDSVARASLVVSALSGTVSVEVYDGSNALKASGVMASPWAAANAATVMVGATNAAAITVTSGGVPTSLWYCQFRSGTRFVRGTFGLAGSGADFVWSLSSFSTGSKGTIGAVTFTATGSGLAPTNSVAPLLSGTTQVGSVLSCGAGTWENSPTGFAYQWQRSANGSSGWTAISGETLSSYTLSAPDQANYIRTLVTASNALGSASAASNALGPITQPVVVTPSTALHVLWIGNSLTDMPGDMSPPTYTPLPERIKPMLAELGITLTYEARIQGGANFSVHRANVATMADCASSRFDAVNVQGYYVGYNNAAAYLSETQAFYDACVSAGSILLQEEIWSFVGDAGSPQFPAAANAVEEASFQRPASCAVQVMRVWNAIETSNPTLAAKMHIDPTHQGMLGEYVNALCYTRFFSGRSVQGITSINSQALAQSTAGERQAIKDAVDANISMFFHRRPVSKQFDSLYARDFRLDSATDAKSQPTQAKPAKSTNILTGGYTDQRFGTAVRRVTSVSDITGASSTYIRHEYSRRQAFNADGTMFLAQSLQGWWFLYDATTCQIIPSGITSGAGTGGIQGLAGDCEPFWHPTDPLKLWHTVQNGGLVWTERTVSRTGGTPSATTLFDMGPRLAALGSPWSGGAKAWFNGEGRPSIDGRWWCFAIETSSFGSIGAVMYDRQTNTITGSVLTGGNRPNWIGTSPLGNYMVLSWYGTAQASIAAENAQANSAADGVRIFDRTGANQRTLSVLGEHSDMMLDAEGRECYVWISFRGASDGVGADAIAVRRMSDGSAYTIPISAYAGTGTGFHVSGCATDRPGWAVIGKYVGVGSGPYDGQVMIAELKATSPRVYRLAHTRVSLYDYFAEPHPTPSRDLSRVLFASDFGAGTTPYEDYQVCLPSWVVPG